MARARNIKPGLFKNEILGVADPLYTLLFEGLWLLADREGRLEDRPMRIKAEIFPYREGLNVNAMLDWLQSQGFIVRYSAGGVSCIFILEFRKHQNPHKNETESELPSPDERDDESEDIGRELECLGTTSEKIGTAPADSLFSDSLIPDSLNSDSLSSAGGAVALPAEPAPRKQTKAEKQQSNAPTAQTWQAYANAYRERYKVAPVRNATVNGQLTNFVTRLGAEEAPRVAEFYVWHNNRYYAQQMHSVGPMVKDAEKLRTEWATGNRMTATQANQADKTQSNGDVFGKLIREAQDAQSHANA